MKKIVFVSLFLAVFLALNARAQIMEGVYNTVTSPMDKVEDSHEKYYANVAFAGDAENARSQEERYERATVPVNKAALRHVNALTDYEPISGHDPEEISGK